MCIGYDDERGERRDKINGQREIMASHYHHLHTTEDTVHPFLHQFVVYKRISGFRYPSVVASAPAVGSEGISLFHHLRLTASVLSMVVSYLMRISKEGEFSIVNIVIRTHQVT